MGKASECHRNQINLDNVRALWKANGMPLSLDISACLYYGYDNNRHLLFHTILME